MTANDIIKKMGVCAIALMIIGNSMGGIDFPMFVNSPGADFNVTMVVAPTDSSAMYIVPVDCAPVVKLRRSELGFWGRLFYGMPRGTMALEFSEPETICDYEIRWRK